MMQPPIPGQLPPEDLQRFMAEREYMAAHNRQVQEWYEGQVARLEVEHRERILKFAAILCRCWDREPCPVHGTSMVTADGRVL
jgi:hypothetical protein